MENEKITPTPIIEEALPESPIPAVTTANKSSGAMIGTIIVIVILVLGGFYLWSTKVQPVVDQKNAPVTATGTEEQQATNENAAANATVEQLATQSPSDETVAIENDLNATALDGIDKDLQAI
jgi:hypothetical protein